MPEVPDGAEVHEYCQGHGPCSDYWSGTCSSKRWLYHHRRTKHYSEYGILVTYLGIDECRNDHSPGPESTDGEASLPGPRLRRRGPRSLEALHKPRCRGPARERINAADQSVHLDEEKFNIFFVNIRGFVSHPAELTGMLRLYIVLPEIVCLNETFLNRSIEDVELEGYSVVARRDRKDGRQGGGVLVFARRDVANLITLIEKSQTAERVWLIIHAETGPYLMCLWYCPPDPGEVASIDSLVTEFGNHCAEALGTIILGDMNVHHTRWLRHSARTSTEGVALKDFCDASGLRQVVRAPTRGDHLLDFRDSPNQVFQ